MPTYDYKRADGTVFEAFQSITAEPLTECPTTGQPVERIISGGTGFILKGSGFYQTDYVTKPDHERPKGGKSDGKESSAETKTSEASADKEKSASSKSED